MWAIGYLSTALGSTDPCAVPIDEFRHVVDIATSGVATVTESYRFRAPAPACEAVVLPRLLDGTVLVDAELAVQEGRLLRRPQWKEGDVLQLQRSASLGRGPHSFEVKRPLFEVGSVAVEVHTPTNGRLNVWAEPHAVIAVDRTRTLNFSAFMQGGGRLVWSTESDWSKVADRFRATMDPKIASTRSLGPLADELKGVSIAEIVKRVAATVRLDPLGVRWADARNATDILAAGSGSASERALVLVSLLRAAGHEAEPVLLRPADAVEVPLVVPGTAMFPAVAVKVQQPDGPVWLDPVSPFTATGAMPLGLRGAVVLEKGDQPRKLYDRMTPDGRVLISARAVLGPNGSVEVNADVVAEDGATQAVRDVLGPLAKDVRSQWLSDLLRVVRPGLDKLRFQVFGVDDPAHPFGMALEFTVPGAFQKLGDGAWTGTLPPLLAPQLARVLPANIEVVEILEFVGNDELRPFGAVPVQEKVDPAAVISRSMLTQGTTTTVRTGVLRPWRSFDAEERSRAALDEASFKGPQLFLFNTIDPVAMKSLQRNVPSTEGRVLESLLWLEVDDEARSRKALQRAVKGGRFRKVVSYVGLAGDRGELRPWDTLWELAENDSDRLAIVEALEAKSEQREAWRRASMLSVSTDPLVQIQALFALSRVQGDRPSASVDAPAHRAWREPVLLLKRAAALAEKNAPGRPQRDIDLALAQRLLGKGVCQQAGDLIQPQLAVGGKDPLTQVLQAEWESCISEGAPPTADLEALILQSNYDPEVIRAAVRVWTASGMAMEARRWAMLAAQVSRTNETVWMEASSAALLAGDLGTAVYAARRASDLRPKSMTSGIPMQILATLAGDAASANLATERTDYQVSIHPLPIPFTEAFRFMEPQHRLGFLRQRDAEVLNDKVLLQERHDRALAAGDILAARRDAEILVRRHRVYSAEAGLYKTSSEALWSTHAIEGLDRAASRDTEVRRLRMETGFLTGASDPMRDAPSLRGDPDAVLLMDANSRRSTFQERVAWPSSEPIRYSPPPGFKESRLLGAVDGVKGYTNATIGAILLVSSVPDRLPPPLDGLFRLSKEAESDGKVAIHRLEDGMADAFVASRTLGETTYWGAARSRALAKFALESGISAHGQ